MTESSDTQRSLQPMIPRPQTGHGPDRDFYVVAERYLDDMMRLNPFVATYLGYHKYDRLMDDMSSVGIATKIAFYESAQRRFHHIDASRLSPSAQVDRALIQADVATGLFNLKQLRSHEKDPQVYNDIIGYGTLYLTILEPGSPDWPARLQALISRMEALPAFLNAARTNLKNPPRVMTEFIIEQNRGNIAFFEESLPPLFEPFPEFLDKLRRSLPRAVDALRSYQVYLEKELLACSSGDWRLGEQLWTEKLQLTLQSDLSPEEIARRAWDRLHAERRAMLELARPLHDRKFPEHRHTQTGDDLTNVIVGEVLAEAAKNHSTPDGLFDDCKRWVDKIKDFIRRRDFITLPPESDNFVVEPTPAFLDGMAVAFFNPAPAFEPHLKKSFWISSIPASGDPVTDGPRTESFLREYNNYGLQNLTIHEAFPGHYVQFYYALSSPVASIYKKVFASNTFAEGWAVLCEELIFEAGYAADEPEALLVHKKMALRAPINAILDAHLHTHPMKESAADRWALDLMRRYGFQEEAEAIRKLRRAKITSTQLSTYFVGFQELSDLLDEYRRRFGNAFRLKEFNEKLLSFGTIPPRAVRRLMLSS